MFKLPVRTWILNAAAVFSGRHGAVTRQAEQAGCSRQTVYQHAQQARTAARRRAGGRSPDRGSIPARGGRRAGAGGRPPRPPRQGQAQGTGDHRLRHGPEPAADRGPPGRAPARRRSPRPFDPGALGPGRGPPRRGRPGGAGPGLCRPGQHPGPRRDLFWGRPTLVGIEPASMTAVFCRGRRPQGRDLGGAIGPVPPPGVRRLRRRQGDRCGGGAAGRGPARRPLGPAAGARAGRLPHRHGSPPGPGPALATRRGGLGEGGRGRCQGRRGEATGDRCTGPGQRGRRRMAAGERGLRGGRAARSGLGPGRLCAGVVRCRRPAQRPQPGRRPRSPRR